MSVAPNGRNTPATAWCLTCGDTYLRADGKCARCGQANGVRVPTTAILDPLVAPARPKVAAHKPATPEPSSDLPAAAPEPPASPKPVSHAALPTHGWLEETRALAAWLEDRLAELNAQLWLVTSQIDAVRAVLEAFDEPHREEAPVPSDDAPQDTTPRWSQLYDACIDCGSTEVRHAAKGRCYTCYGRHHKATQQGASA